MNRVFIKSSRPERLFLGKIRVFNERMTGKTPQNGKFTAVVTLLKKIILQRSS